MHGQGDTQLRPRAAPAQTFSSVPQEVLFILGANLSQIEDRWDSGRLRSAGLSAQHVTSLVSSKLLFSPGRLPCPSFSLRSAPGDICCTVAPVP